jgi:acylphosphatase
MPPLDDDDDDEELERRNAELEFVSAAYAVEEAWTDTGNDGVSIVYRRLNLPANENDEARILLQLTMPYGYPTHSPLQIAATVDESSSSNDMKSVWNALPHLIQACREEADSLVGMEAVLSVMSRADVWVNDEWPNFSCSALHEEPFDTSVTPVTPSSTSVLGRRLIYSHHLISKIKRADIRALASQYDLTGYVKVGWPGIILIEGDEDACNAFYDEIRKWAWKYLVVRGEQQEENGTRKFTSFVETEDMSVVAQHCREVGLEALFKTSMKVYDNSDENDNSQEQDDLWGTLVLVDHMNDAKRYRQWLRKTSRQLDCVLFIQQCYLDYTKRPLIIVGVVGTSVSEFMKRWRTSRVDVDSRGRPCLERQMTVIIDGPLDCTILETVEWDKVQTDEHLNASLEQLQDLIASIGGSGWSCAFDDHIRS